MARTRQITNAFNSGEISPLLAGRSDLEKYKNGVGTLENFICFKHGGVYSRPGTRYVASAKNANKKCRLINFEFNTSNAYIIEMGDGYMRFYKNGAQIISGTPVEIVSPYAEADLFKVTFAQSADVLYMACQGYAPQTLTRTSDTSWAIADTVFVSSPWAAGPFPACVCLYEQRAWYANTVNDPDTIWGSQTGDYLDFTVGTGLDNEAVTLTLASRKLNAINWLAGQGALIAGTSGQEHFITGGGGPDDPITPSSSNSKSRTKYGSAAQAAVESGNALLFLQRSGRKLREITIDPSSDSYNGPFPDVSLLSEHITDGGITQMAYQQELDSIVWAVRSDGCLLSMTYEKAQDVIGWARHITGPLQDFTDGKFESVAVIPHPDGDQDQTWVVVNRTIGGATKRYIELLETKQGYYDRFQVDCGLLYSGAAASTITGLTHLIGQTVDILGNGVVYPQQVVDGSGHVSGLSPKVTKAEIGIPFAGALVTLPPEAGASDGTAQGGRKRINDITVRLFETGTLTVDGELLEFRTASDDMDKPVPLTTGDERTNHQGWDTAGRMTVRRTQPLPVTILAIITMLTVND